MPETRLLARRFAALQIPHRVVISDCDLKEGNVDYQLRRDEEATAVKLVEVAAEIEAKLNT